MQAAVFFLVRALFISLADKIKIIPIDGESRPTISMVLTAGIGPLAQRGQGFILVSHCIFSATWVIKKEPYHTADTKHNTEKIRGLRAIYSLPAGVKVSISCINFS